MEKSFSSLNFPFPQIRLVEIYSQNAVLTLSAAYQKNISLKTDLLPHTLGPMGIRWLNRGQLNVCLKWRRK